MARDNDSLFLFLGLGVAAFLGLRLARAHKAPPRKVPMGIFAADPVDSQLTANFRELEFKHSSHPALNYKLQRYVLPSNERANLLALASGLQTARDVLGMTITVTGGGRPDAVVDDQGRGFYEYLKSQGYDPAKDSQHRTFSAADVTVASPGARWALFDTLRQLPVFGEVILYIDNAIPTRVHVALRQNGIEPQHLIAEGGRYRKAPPVDVNNRLVS